MAHVSKWHWRNGLAGALLLRVVVPLLSIMIGFGYLLLWTVERGSERRLQEEVELVARAVRLPISYSLERNRETTVQEALRSVLQIGRVYGAYVYDRDGRLIAASASVEPGQSAAERKELAAVDERTGKYQIIKGRPVFSFFLPLEDSGGRINGLLQVTRRQGDFEHDIRNLRLIAGGLSSTLALAAIVIVLLGHRAAIGKHLQRLAQSMVRVSAGERAHRAPLGGPQEIAALGAALNSMLDSITAAEERLAQQQAREDRLQEQLRRNEQLAAVGRLAAGVAHELGSPLSVIEGRAQRALRSPALDQPQREVLKQIRREVDRLSNIVRQLLDFGRAAGRARGQLSAAAIVRSAVTAVADELAERRVDLQLELPAEAVACQVDPTRFEQALTNLLRNAAQASPGGTVSLRCWQQGERVLFQVEDDGPGIAADHKAALFEPFFTTKPPGKGSGLGLAVAHGVVAEHDGRLSLVQGSLSGAAFRIELPIVSHDEELDNAGA